jgi:serine/threonine protein kinase
LLLFGNTRTIARLMHPHIVRVLDFGVDSSTPFLVMEYAPNGTLHQRRSDGTGMAGDIAFQNKRFALLAFWKNSIIDFSEVSVYN